MGKQDRAVIQLQRGMLYASGETIGAKNSFQDIQYGSVKLFSGDNTKFTGPGARSCSENTRNKVEISHLHERLLNKLQVSYGKVHKLRKPGERGSEVKLREV